MIHVISEKPSVAASLSSVLGASKHENVYFTSSRNHQQFASLLLYLAPDFPLSIEDIQTQIESAGLDGFIRSTGGHAADLAETCKLIAGLEKRGT